MTFQNFFKHFKEGMQEFGETIAIIINSILLSAVYFIGVGLTSFFAFLAKKNFLEYKLERDKHSYWEELNLSKEKKEAYYKQF